MKFNASTVSFLATEIKSESQPERLCLPRELCVNMKSHHKYLINYNIRSLE